MNTFELIVYKLINIENNIFSPKYDKYDKVGGIHKIFFGFYISNKIYKIYKSKFHFFNETIHNFYFLNKDDNRNDFIHYFHKVQKIYHILNNFCYKYKIKKSKLVVDTDLHLNTIEIKDKNIICIYHNQCRYLFKIEDLLKIIYNSLTNTYIFFCEPITIKNPYNNLPFGKSILYYVYFQIINTFKIGYTKNTHLDIFLKFAECNFNITKFTNNYEHILRELSIQNYLKNTCKPQLKEDIDNMINGFNHSQGIQRKIVIHKEFPIHELIRIMKPYLYLYLNYNYSLVPKIKLESKNRLYKKLHAFISFNPSFGRKNIVLKQKFINGKIKKFKSHIDFNLKHKKFNVYDNDNFMNNHLSYKYSDDNILEYEDEDYFNIEHQTTSRNLNFFMQLVVIGNNQVTDTSNTNEENVNDELNDEDYDEQHDEDSIS